LRKLYRLQFNQRKYTVVLPKRYVEKLGWKKGEELDIILKGKTIIIHKPKSKQR